MAYYYVKSGFGTSTAVASSTTQRTGAFSSMTAADTYAKIADVMSYNTMAAGDFICCSDLHSSTAVSAYTSDNTAGSGFYTIMSVDDSNCDQYKAGAYEGNSSGYYDIGGSGWSIFFKGMTFDSKDGVILGNDASCPVLEDGAIKCTYGTSFGDYAVHANDSYLLVLRDVDIEPVGVAGGYLISVYLSSSVEWTGGSMVAAANDIGYLVKFGSIGHGKVTIDSVDLSTHSGFALSTTPTYASTEGAYLTLKNCKLPASWSYVNSAILGHYMELNVINTAPAVKYFIGKHNFWGTSQTQSTYARSGGCEVDGTGIAYEVTTSANCQDEMQGHRFHLCSLSADFSTAKTVTAYMQYSSAGATDLQDDEIWIEVHVPKSGSPDMVIYKSYLDSNSQGGVTWTDAPADYANNTETWSGSLSNAVRQEMEITTAGSEDDGIAHIYVVVAKPSLTVYVDPGVDVA